MICNQRPGTLSPSPLHSMGVKGMYVSVCASYRPVILVTKVYLNDLIFIFCCRIFLPFNTDWCHRWSHSGYLCECDGHSSKAPNLTSISHKHLPASIHGQHCCIVHVCMCTTQLCPASRYSALTRVSVLGQLGQQHNAESFLFNKVLIRLHVFICAWLCLWGWVKISRQMGPGQKKKRKRKEARSGRANLT